MEYEAPVVFRYLAVAFSSFCLVDGIISIVLPY